VVRPAGVTVTGIPLVTTPKAWSMLPVPPEKTAVKEVDVPAVMGFGVAVKLVMAGAATTVTLTDWVTEVPAELVTVSV